MSKAIRCDRCGEFCENPYAYKIEGNKILAEVPYDYYYPDSQDLCEKCGENLCELIKTWWRKKK